MPPLELDTGSYYAARGSSEADELYERAKSGEFVVFSADNYVIFSNRDTKDHSQTVAAFAIETDAAVLARFEYDALEPEEVRKMVYPTERSRVAGSLGTVASKIFRKGK